MSLTHMLNYKDKLLLNKMKKEEKLDKLNYNKKETQKVNKLKKLNLKEKPQENG